jgi:hypothetical protein
MLIAFNQCCFVFAGDISTLGDVATNTPALVCMEKSQAKGIERSQSERCRRKSRQRRLGEGFLKDKSSD